MAKRGGIPWWGWFLGVGVVVGVIAESVRRNPRCPRCKRALSVVEEGSKYVCPQCQLYVGFWELVFGLARRFGDPA
jgi:hypothetical protein